LSYVSVRLGLVFSCAFRGPRRLPGGKHVYRSGTRRSYTPETLDTVYWAVKATIKPRTTIIMAVVCVVMSVERVMAWISWRELFDAGVVVSCQGSDRRDIYKTFVAASTPLHKLKRRFFGADMSADRPVSRRR